MLEEDGIPELTLQPSRFEQGWLLQAFRDWLEDGTVVDVLYRVRGGKEAEVYCCRAGPSLDGRLLAAKVYRPRKFRELSNDAMYREGRGLLDGEGHAQKGRDQRLARAVRRGTRFGKEVSHVSWVHHELAALRRLYEAGGSVPEPFAATENAVLMGFVGDEDGAAPTLDKVRPARERVPALLAETLRNVELLLDSGWVHGDLSLYNLMYWQDQVVVIDLPQVSDVLRNPHGPGLFRRDVERVCQGFARLGAEALDPAAVGDAIWDRVFRTDGGVPVGSLG